MLRDRWQKSKPLSGVRILHKIIPLTFETLVKLESIVAAGAHITVTHVGISGLQLNPEAIEVLKQAGVEFVQDHTALSGEYDIALDCA